MRANLKTLRSPEFKRVLLRESCGGNAGFGHAAVNFAARRDRIIALGNFQEWPRLVQVGVHDGAFIHGTIRVKLIGDGPAFELASRDHGEAIRRAIEILNCGSRWHRRTVTVEDLIAVKLLPGNG